MILEVHGRHNIYLKNLYINSLIIYTKQKDKVLVILYGLIYIINVIDLHC